MRENLRILLTTIGGQDSTILARLFQSSEIVLFGLNHNPRKYQESRSYRQIANIDFRNSQSVANFVFENRVEVIVNTAALSSVQQSFQKPLQYEEVNYIAVKNLLRILADNQYTGSFLQFGSTDMFGTSKVSTTQKTLTPWSPYGVAKAQSFELVRNYRAEHGFKFSNLVMTNHDSNLRPNNYVIKNIANQFVRNVQQNLKEICIEDSTISRDWASAEDLMRGVLNFIEIDIAGDYAFATGQSTTLKELISDVAKRLNISVRLKESGSPDLRKSQIHRIDVDVSETKNDTGWRANMIGSDTLVAMIHEQLTENRISKKPFV